MAARVIGERFRLERSLSTTVMSEVWLALDPELDRQVVVKLLAADADRARFEREAQAAAGLSHENIVRLFDYGEEGGRPYMVFEYLPGGTLDDRLEREPELSVAAGTRIARDVAGGLARAHEQGVVHRDLKPANVLFDDEGRAKIADFGIASLGGATTLTDAGTILGTAAYMSPEQAAGEPATPASDVYSFGVVLYRMLAGRLPFEAGNPAELAAMHRSSPATPLAALRPDVPPALAELTMRALAKRPEDRPASGTALAELLTLDAPPATAAEAATRVLPVARPRRSRRRLPPVFAAGFSVLLLAALGAVAAVWLTGHGSSAGHESPVKTTRSTRSAHPARTGATSTSKTSSTTSTHATSTTRATTTRPTTAATSTTLPVPPTITVTTTTPTTADTTTTAGP
jgi:eukaryotic-like serine/threonine-protein kinase